MGSHLKAIMNRESRTPSLEAKSRVELVAIAGGKGGCKDDLQIPCWEREVETEKRAKEINES